MLKHTLAILILASVGCWGSVDGGSRGDDGDAGPEENELLGAGDRDITEFWPDIDLPYSQNTKLLSYDMLINEVRRATGRSWVIDGVDQWELNKSALGGADYVNTFEDDRTISQSKIVALRKMAFSVCGDLVAAENGATTAAVFTIVKPNVSIAADDTAVSSQVESLYQRFFLVAPSPAEVAEHVQLLVDLQAQTNSTEAWRGLCGAYLASMRFLSY